jgi:multidrug efflux pump
MVLSDVSIKRPVFASVISLMLVVLGFAALTKLSIREYPAIDPPIVSVTTVYKGASNEVVESRVTEIIEAAVSGIEGVRQITSQSREERSSVTIEFRLGRDIDGAAADVRDRVSRVLGRLPTGVETPVIAKVDSDARAIIWFTLASTQFNQMELSDYAARYIRDRLSIVPGVASVTISGERRISMRVWIDRAALAARSLTVDDVERAIRSQNVELPGGRIESTARELTVKTDSRLSTPQQFREIIVANRAGTLVRLGEVARVEVAAEDDRGEIRANRNTSIGLGILRQSTANTLSVADGVKAEMETLRRGMPDHINILVGYDESLFIRQSIFEVQHALMIGIGLVIGVIFVFLRSWRATIIPAIAIPVSIIASCSVLAAMGFSVNTLTLLALVLAIGIVVDDAIVVLENIHRRIELGEPVLLASVRGARQIAFAVIATTLTLGAVFVPISFMEGNVGRLFTEFGIAMAAAVMFSGLVALSLTPMMCSKLLRHHSGEGWLYRHTERAFDAVNGSYRWLLRRALAMPIVILAGGAAISALAFALWTVLPKELTPLEDRGVFIVRVTAPEGSSLAYTREQVRQIENCVMPVVERGDAFGVMSNIAPGFQRPAPVNEAFVFVRLQPWNDRAVSQQQLVREVTPCILRIAGVRAVPINPPSLGQRGIQPPVQVSLLGSEYEVLRGWRDRMFARMIQDGRFINPDSNYRENKPEIRVQIDRARAADLGIPIDVIGRTLEVMFGSREVNTFTDRGEEYKVLLQARAEDRASPRDLTNLFVRPIPGGGQAAAGGAALIPLSNLVTLQEAAGPQELNRVDRRRSITLTAQLAPGFTLDEALQQMERFIADELPPEARFTYQGTSREFKESSASLYFTFALALIIVFLVLAAQFESWIHPMIIMLVVPLAVTGGLGALYLTGISLNVYSQIGMILLIGLMAKNGILIVEFANQLRDEGKSVHDAVLEASVVRLRPILMTSIATVAGAVPLAYAAGAGAESRMSIGWVIIGGVSFATVLTSFLVPSLYLLLAGFTKPVNAIAQRLTQMERGEAPTMGRQLPAE